MKKLTKAYFEAKSIKYPKTYVKLVHDGHTIITDWKKCRKSSSGRIEWKKSIRKPVAICRDGIVKQFVIVGYTKKPSSKAHDTKLLVQDKKTKKIYKIWARDFKQGDVGKLFK